MTRSEYASAITKTIDEATGYTAEYPESFESDIDACFLQRLSVEDAYEKLYEQWFGRVEA